MVAVSDMSGLHTDWNDSKNIFQELSDQGDNGMEFAIGFIIGEIVTIIIWRKQIFRELYEHELK